MGKQGLPRYDRCCLCLCWVHLESVQLLTRGMLGKEKIEWRKEYECVDYLSCSARTVKGNWFSLKAIGLEEQPNAKWLKCIACDAARSVDEVNFEWDTDEDGEMLLDVTCIDRDECDRLCRPPYYYSVFDDRA